MMINRLIAFENIPRIHFPGHIVQRRVVAVCNDATAHFFELLDDNYLKSLEPVYT